PIPQLLGQVMSHAVDEHQPGAVDRPGDRATAEGPHQLVGAPVNHHGRRDDAPVVVPQAAAAQDRAELLGDTPRVEVAVVALGGCGVYLLFGCGVPRTADDLADPDRVIVDDVPG